MKLRIVSLLAILMMLCVVPLALSAQESTPAPEASAEVTPDLMSEASPEPTAEATVEATTEASAEASAEATPEVTVEPTEQVFICNQSVDRSSPNAAAETYVLRGRTYEGQRNFGQARAEYDCAVEVAPEYFSGYFYRGLFFSNRGEFDLALADMDRAVALRPELPDGYLGRATVLLEIKQYDQALADASRALERADNGLDPISTRMNGHLLRGLIYIEQGSYTPAIHEFNLTIAIAADVGAEPPVLAYLNRGIAQANRGNRELALQDVNTGLVLSPQAAVGYYARGRVYAVLGELAAAITDFQTALNLDPNHIETYYELGKLYDSLGDVELAVAHYTRYVELAGGAAEADVVARLAALSG